MTEILPTSFKPSNYILYFKPQPEQNQFVGKTTIDVSDVKDIYSNCLLPLDVHLMVNEPKNLIKK